MTSLNRQSDAMEASTSQGLARLTMGLILVVAAFSVVGCSDGLPANQGVVTGVVTVDGEKVQEGTITFYTPVSARSVNDAKPSAYGDIVDGSYSLESPVGAAKVAIRVPKVVGQKKAYNTPDSPLMSITEESIPEKYNRVTELTIDVTHGTTERDFELSTE